MHLVAKYHRFRVGEWSLGRPLKCDPPCVPLPWTSPQESARESLAGCPHGASSCSENIDLRFLNIPGPNFYIAPIFLYWFKSLKCAFIFPFFCFCIPFQPFPHPPYPLHLPPLPLLVGITVWGGGGGGLKLISTPPSMTLGNWIGPP